MGVRLAIKYAKSFNCLAIWYCKPLPFQPWPPVIPSTNGRVRCLLFLPRKFPPHHSHSHCGAHLVFCRAQAIKYAKSSQSLYHFIFPAFHLRFFNGDSQLKTFQDIFVSTHIAKQTFCFTTCILRAICCDVFFFEKVVLPKYKIYTVYERCKFNCAVQHVCRQGPSHFPIVELIKGTRSRTHSWKITYLLFTV